MTAPERSGPPIARHDARSGDQNGGGLGGLGSKVLGLFAVVALGSTIALGLALPPTREQDVLARLIAVHPPLAWAAYLSFGVTAIASVLWLIPRTRAARWDHIAAASVEVGVVFTGLTLATGSIWGRPTWGVWWTWDARLTLTALMFFLYLGYLALRRVPADVDVRARRSAIVALLSVAVVPINHFAVEWWRTLHQGRSLADIAPRDNLDGEYVTVMLLGFLAMTLVYGWLLLQRYRVERLADRLDAVGLERAIAERRAEAAADADADAEAEAVVPT